jgi:hypothetical protein
MQAEEKTKKTRTKPPKPTTVAWGAEYIGAEIDRTTRQTYHLLEAKPCGIKCAKKHGKTWFAPVAALRREFGIDDGAV